MGLTEATVDRRLLKAVCSVLLLVVLALWVRTCQFSPPQMGSDPEVFHTVDALFTAITSRSQKQLDDCDQRLVSCREAGTLPKKSADYLDSVIRQARAGDWQPAAKRLYDFMYGQRRQ